MKTLSSWRDELHHGLLHIERTPLHGGSRRKKPLTIKELLRYVRRPRNRFKTSRSKGRAHRPEHISIKPVEWKMPIVKALITLEKGGIHIEGTQEFVEKYLAQSAPPGQIQSIIVSGQHSEESEKILIKEGLDHAWNWFSLHAEQRMQCVNFFLVAAAFLSGAYVTALRFAHPLAAAGVGLLGFFLSICFNRFELRIRELVKAGEAALGPAQRELAKITGIANLNLLDSVETPKALFTAYSTVIPTLHWLTGAAFLLGAFYAYQQSIAKGLSPGWQDLPLSLAYRVLVLIAAIFSIHYGYRLLTHEARAPGGMRRLCLLCGVVLTLGGLAIVAVSLYLPVS